MLQNIAMPSLTVNDQAIKRRLVVNDTDLIIVIGNNQARIWVDVYHYTEQQFQSEVDGEVTTSTVELPASNYFGTADRPGLITKYLDAKNDRWVDASKDGIWFEGQPTEEQIEQGIAVQEFTFLKRLMSGYYGVKYSLDDVIMSVLHRNVYRGNFDNGSWPTITHKPAL